MKCHECKHSKTIPGDCHLGCQEGLDQCLSGKAGNIHVSLNPHGVQNGWALWPFNFDPIWVDNCNSFESRECTTL